MRIAISALQVDPEGVGGIDRYASELLLALAKVSSPHEYLLLVRDSAAAALRSRLGDRWKIVPVRWHIRPQRVLWESVLINRHLERAQIDVLHATNLFLPLSPACRTVLTVHDTLMLEMPGAFDWAKRNVGGFLFRGSLKRADVLAVDSSSTLTGLRRIGLEGVLNKAMVTGAGVGQFFFQRVGELEQRAVVHRLGISSPFLLYVGDLSPRKNIPMLLRSFEIAVRRYGLDHSLVLAGNPGPRSAEALEALRRSSMRARIRQVGPVSDHDLRALYQLATATLLISTAEGFGLPVCESLACRTPVVASNVAPICDHVGDAGLLVDPTDAGAIAESLARISRDGELRVRLAESAERRASAMSWDAVAERVLQAYDRAGMCASGVDAQPISVGRFRLGDEAGDIPNRHS